MELTQAICDLLHIIGPGHMMSTAYDTAWIARLSELDEPIGRQALDWLRDHQLADGSWGTETPSYYHDRLICTLAAAIALKRYGGQQDNNRLSRAKDALETVVKALADSAMIETIGFELIIPTLFREAEALGIVQRWEDHDMAWLNRQRTLKLAGLPGGLINRRVTLAFSAEMAGADSQRLLDVANLQEANGSVGHSPSATAYFALQVRRGDAAALNYLRNLPNPDKGIPDVAPFDNFERSWTLWNFKLLALSDSVSALYQPHTDFLGKAWKLGQGAGYAAGYSVVDADMTSVIYEVLAALGQPASIDEVLRFEEDEYFRCFALEANPSVSVNIHVLGALRQAGFQQTHPAVRKIRQFLQSTQYWFDKWHVSPYYPTSHAIIACAGFMDDLIEDAVSWIVSTQNPDGSWGYFAPTAEETAYSLQALAIWKRNGKPVADEILERGADWLAQHQTPPYLPLWIGKCLYNPVWVVRSAVLSAQMLVSQELGVKIC